MGACPSQYRLIEAARWLGVAPWELMNKPQIWTEWALNHRSASIAVGAGES